MRNRVSIDILSLGAGAVIAVVGAFVLVDSSGVFDLSLGWMTVALTAALGVILLLSGLAREPERDDD